VIVSRTLFFYRLEFLSCGKFGWISGFCKVFVRKNLGLFKIFVRLAAYYFNMILPKKYWKYASGGLVLALVLLVAAWTELPDRKMHLQFLDVGQGDAILIQTPEGHNILIDGGPKSNVMEELSDTLPFFNRDIDFMVLTHPHADHLEGLVEVLERYRVKAVLITGVAYNNVYYDEFLKELSRLVSEGGESGDGGNGESGVAGESGFKLFIAQANMDFRVGSVLFDVIYPISSLAGREVTNLNNSSIVMRVSYKDLGGSDGEQRILLSGDCEIECEEEILAEGIDLRADIYKAGHHGSKTASSPSYVQAIAPKIAVIQCGEGNKFGHPHAETLRTFYSLGITDVWRNDLDGRIEFTY